MFMNSATAKSEKNRVMQRVQVALDAMADRIHAQSSYLIAQKLIRQQEFIRAKTVGIFVGFGGEVDTVRLMEAALGLGKRVAAPTTNIQSRRLVWREVTDPNKEIDLGPLGIPEPLRTGRDVDAGWLDLITVPGLVWDEGGRRLALWPGYFERFLQINPRAYKVGLGFELQVKPDLSEVAGSPLVNALITEDQVRRFGFASHPNERRLPGGPKGYKGYTGGR
jgi:5-formyltetrahydrofolate cyclo-ligase